LPKYLTIDVEKVRKKIVRSIKEYVKGTAYPRVVLGLSGGVDSSLAAALCSEALGGESVLGLSLPDKATPKADILLAERVAKQFNIEFSVVDITPITSRVFEVLPIFDSSDLVSAGNVAARTRMMVLYYYANRQGRLVVGTGDRSELLIGYFTKYGDAGADFLPLSSLYKTQVRQLARHVGVPAEIVERKSTPGLWEGQTAESELGLSYEVVDLVLYKAELGFSTLEISQSTGISPRMVKTILSRVQATEHKRKGPAFLGCQREIEVLSSGMEVHLKS
jgi:NAD+ synthase